MKIEKALQKRAQEILRALEQNGVNVSKYKGLAEELSKKLEKDKERARLYRRKDSQLTPEELQARQDIRQARQRAKEERERVARDSAEQIANYKHALSVEKGVTTLNSLTNIISVIDNEKKATLKKNALTSLNSLLGLSTEIDKNYIAQTQKELKKARERARYKKNSNGLKTALASIQEINNVRIDIAKVRLSAYNRNYYFTKTKTKRKLKKEQGQ